MIIVRININHEKDRTVVKERKATNVFMIENIFS